MEELINTDYITLDYIGDTNEYRLSLFDENYHYVDEVYLTPEQLKDLIDEGQNLEIRCKDDEFQL